jgi:uncharacterized tellurite resistance protein B-like protein
MAMLERLRQLFSAGAGEAASAGRSFEERQLAAAALLVEAASMDSDFDAVERAKIEQLLQSRFALSPTEAEQLLGQAEQAAGESVEWQGFTRAVKDGFAPEDRIQVIEMLWEVAYADGQLHDYEASLLRRITGLLYVSDWDSGEARKRVLARLGVQG